MRRNPRTKNVEILELEQFNTLRINKKNFLNIVAIVGIARAGKSTLMNCLAGDNVFKISHSFKACTHGVWLSQSKKIGDNGVVVYADTEGEGNDCTDNDVKLLAPVLMLSKVVILNVGGKVLVGELLEKLELLVHIAKRIKNKKNDQFKFGHLIIAVRDFNYEDGTVEQGWAGLGRAGQSKYERKQSEMMLFFKNLTQLVTKVHLSQKIGRVFLILN